MPLGASRVDIIGMVLRQTSLLLALGTVLGIALALAATRGAGSLLFGLQPHDPLTFAAAGALRIRAALLPRCVAGLRASPVDPLAALRYQQNAPVTTRRTGHRAV